MFFEMVFVLNICTVKTYDKTSAKYKSTQIWNELKQHLNLDLLDQSRPKTKKSFFWIFLKILGTIITNKTPAKSKHSNYGP